MRMKHAMSGLMLAGLLMNGSTATADEHALGLAATAKIGTLGLGIELTKGITDNMNVRAGLNGFSYDYSSVESNVDYKFDLDLRSVSLLADWYPGSGGFRLTGGALLNGNEISGRARPTDGTYEIDGVNYDSADVGTLSAKIDFKSLAPYVGIGWGNALGTDARWHFALDVGLLFQGSPSARLSADGILASDPVFQENLRNEQASLQNDVDDFKYYPVFSVGIGYRF